MAEDEAALAERVARRVREWAPGAWVEAMPPLLGGASSRTYSATLRGAPDGCDRVVVKTAIAGLMPTRNRDVLRQARVLRTLESTGTVRVPQVLFDDPGDPPDVPPLFVMNFVDGESVEPNSDEGAGVAPADADARARAAARMLAAMHGDTVAVSSLADDPAVSPSDEIDRWDRADATVDPMLREGAEELRDELRATLPAAVAPVLIHGDWRLGNMLCRGPEILAVIDWEIWARSDPRIDLSWFLYCSETGLEHGREPAGSRMPADDALLEEYRAAGGAELVDFDWFRALNLYKIAAVMALIAKHDVQQGGDPARLVEQGRINTGWIRRGRELLGG